MSKQWEIFFSNFCGLLRIYELYVAVLATSYVVKESFQTVICVGIQYGHDFVDE